MKAFTCPQCGALLQNVSIEKNLARCDYCRAKILIRPIGELTAEKEQEYEISLVTRAEDGEEELETYTRGNLTFTHDKFQPNESLKETLQNMPPQNHNLVPMMVGFGVIVIIGAIALIYWLNS